MDRTPIARWDDICVIYITLAIRKWGSFEPRRGHLTSIEADGQWVCSKKNEITHMIIGDYPYKHRLEKESLTYGP